MCTTENRLDSEEWMLVEDGDVGDIIKIKSRSHQKFLVCSPGGHVRIAENNQILNIGGDRWRICQNFNRKGGFVLISVEYSEYLICDDKGVLSCINENYLDGKSENWDIEFQSGELCFLSLPEYDRRISCDIAGNLSLSKKWKGWEVWRFIECGDGNVYISSWTHHTKILCSNESGDVFTTEERLGSWEKWKIELAQGKNDGVVIKSVVHDRYLRWNGNRLITSKTYEDNRHWTTWHIESAHRQTYFISSLSHDKRIGSRKDRAFTTRNRMSWEQWELKTVIGNDLIIISSKVRGTYLGSNPEGQVSLSAHVGNGEMWKFENSPHGGVFIVSVAHGKALACNKNGHLYTIEGQRGGWETWCLEPIMPPTITGEQMKAKRNSLIIGGSLAVASIALAPFVMGAGGIGAGVMAAEAVASGGSIVASGSVAALQTAGAAGLGVAGTTAAVGAGAAIGGSAIGIALSCSAKKGLTGPLPNSKKNVTAVEMNRPFCAWRSW